MNLKESRVGYIGGFGDRKRKGEIFNEIQFQKKGNS